MKADFLKLSLHLNDPSYQGDPAGKQVVLYSECGANGVESLKDQALTLVRELENELESFELTTVVEFGYSRSLSDEQVKSRVVDFVRRNPSWDIQADDEGCVLGAQERCDFVDGDGRRCEYEGTTNHRLVANVPGPGSFTAVVKLCNHHRRDLGLTAGWETQRSGKP